MTVEAGLFPKPRSFEVIARSIGCPLMIAALISVSACSPRQTDPQSSASVSDIMESLENGGQDSAYVDDTIPKTFSFDSREESASIATGDSLQFNALRQQSLDAALDSYCRQVADSTESRETIIQGIIEEFELVQTEFQEAIEKPDVCD